MTLGVLEATLERPQGTEARLMKLAWAGDTRITRTRRGRKVLSEESLSEDGGVMVFFTGAPANIP